MEDPMHGTLTIRKAVSSDYPKVLDFYWRLIDVMPQLPYSPKWTKDVYPTKEEIRNYLERGELYLAEKEEMIVSSMAVTCSTNDGYDKVSWPSGCKEEEVNYLHLLGVSVFAMQQGIGKQMVQKALAVAKENGAKAMRLDVVEGNLPAEKLYLSQSFQFAGRNLLYYEDTGWCYFRLYEKTI